MAYIYLMTNQINKKQYVGKTVCKNLSRRINNHFSSARNKNDKDHNCPLHRAIRKYGKKNFTVEILEECSEKESYQKEIYWIDKLGTYRSGYNATRGGDGSVCYNYEDIAQLYLKTLNMTETSKIFKCDIGTVRRALADKQIIPLSDGEVSKNKTSFPIESYDLTNGQTIKQYSSQMEAAKDLYAQGIAKFDIANRASLTGTSNRLGQVAKGKRKQSYGLGWRYVKTNSSNLRE